MVSRKSYLLRLTLLLPGLFPAIALAQSGTWIANSFGTYDWSLAGSWLNGVIADGADNTANFATAGLTGPITVNLDSPRTIGSLVFDNPTNTFGWTVIATNPLTLSSTAPGGPTIAVNNPQITATLSVPLAGTQGLTTTGPGTLSLLGTNSYSGGTNVLNGTVQVAADAALGTGNVTGASLGTMSFTATATTTKSFAMNGGTLSAAAGKTVTLNGSVVSSAFLDGAGTFATSAANGAQLVNVPATPSVSITSNNAADQFVHFNNSGSLNVAPGINVNGTSNTVNFNGFVNQGTGYVQIQAATQIDVSNFQSYGTLDFLPALRGANQSTLLANVGSAPLGFNAGSQTFLEGLEGVASMQPLFLNGINLAGKNAIISGGLFVNNGFISDFSSVPGSVIVDYGGLYKGTGFTGVNVVTQNGGKVQAGNSPGSASFGQFVLGPGGVSNYVFTIDDATGTPGATPRANGQASGWGLIDAVKQSLGKTSSTGNFVWTATPNDPLTVALDTIVNSGTSDTDAGAAMANFDSSKTYDWPAVQWTGDYSGPTDSATLDASTSFDTSGFVNPIAGTFGWQFNWGAHSLSLTYTPTPAPEPGTLVLTGVAALALAICRRKYRYSADRASGNSPASQSLV